MVDFLAFRAIQKWYLENANADQITKFTLTSPFSILNGKLIVKTHLCGHKLQQTNKTLFLLLSSSSSYNVYVYVPTHQPHLIAHLPGGMLGGWWFGASPSSPDSNFLRVVNAFPNRRLSDNTLMTPKIRIAPSCASSPGGTPGGGLPIRRHSSIGPQERRGSTINLSPPTVNADADCVT